MSFGVTPSRHGVDDEPWSQRCPVGQLCLQRDAIEVGCMYQCAGLVRYCLRDGRVGVSEAANRDTAQGIQILFMFVVPQPDAFAPFKLHRKTIVGRHNVISHFYTVQNRKGSPLQTASIA